MQGGAFSMSFDKITQYMQSPLDFASVFEYNN